MVCFCGCGVLLWGRKEREVASLWGQRGSVKSCAGGRWVWNVVDWEREEDVDDGRSRKSAFLRPKASKPLSITRTLRNHPFHLTLSSLSFASACFFFGHSRLSSLSNPHVHRTSSPDKTDRNHGISHSLVRFPSASISCSCPPS